MTYKLPIHKTTGSLARRLPYWGQLEKYELREPYEFVATLRYVGIEHTNHSIYATWIDEETGAEYPMFARDFDDLIFSGRMNGSRASGLWGFRATGGYYGIKSLDVPDPAKSAGWYTNRKRRELIQITKGGEVTYGIASSESQDG